MESLHEFLAEKGVDDEFCEQLLAFTADKEYSEYLNWLQDAKAFLE